jgi:hypothetical protein
MPSSKVSSARVAAATAVHGLVGWALCGAAMGASLKMTTLGNALVIHALAAPIIFAGVSFAYYHRSDSWRPVRTAVAFLGCVVVMDVLVVALLLERSFAMFGSILGTWLPFSLIFLSTWLTGLAVRRRVHRSPA